MWTIEQPHTSVMQFTALWQTLMQDMEVWKTQLFMGDYCRDMLPYPKGTVVYSNYRCFEDICRFKCKETRGKTPNMPASAKTTDVEIREDGSRAITTTEW